jgi:hypothetical protein
MHVESDKPTRNGGWLHTDDMAIAQTIKHTPAPVIAEPQIDFDAMFQKWLNETDHYHLDGFAMSLGVDTDALFSLGCAWTGKAWAFPMRDAGSKITGIRLRTDDGQKYAVKGSKQGLFIPDTEAQSTLYILEGVTDAAAALTIGFYAIGRPSCLGCEDMTAKFIRKHKIRRAVVVSDNDAPGIRARQSWRNHCR